MTAEQERAFAEAAARAASYVNPNRAFAKRYGRNVPADR